MRKSYFYLMISIFFTIISCSEDDTNTETQSVDPNPDEEVALDPELVSDNITIVGGTRVTDQNPPNPTGNLPFSLDYTKQSGFLTNGFDITYEYNSNYTGAYIQIINEDGTPSNDYWNVNLSPSFKNTGVISNNKRNKLHHTKTTTNFDSSIDVNFGETIPAGTFCYVICVYDTSGNISQPQEVCVTIEAWGGNPNLIGTWSLTKEDVTYDGETDTYITGEENCEVTTTVTCNNQTTLEIDGAYCETINLYNISFNADGTFSDIYNDTERIYDAVATTENCQVSYTTLEETNFTSTGYWAYNEEDTKLTFIFFNEVYNGTTESYPNGRAYTVDLESVTNSTLILNDSGEETIKEYFTRQ